MSDERQYAEDEQPSDPPPHTSDGSWLHRCECGAHAYRNGRWFSRDGEGAEWLVRMTTYVGCACHVCGSYLFPDGTATPGAEVLWEAFVLLRMQEAAGLDPVAYGEIYMRRARVSLAARKGQS